MSIQVAQKVNLNQLDKKVKVLETHVEDLSLLNASKDSYINNSQKLFSQLLESTRQDRIKIIESIKPQNKIENELISSLDKENESKDEIDLIVSLASSMGAEVQACRVENSKLQREYTNLEESKEKEVSKLKKEVNELNQIVSSLRESTIKMRIGDVTQPPQDPANMTVAQIKDLIGRLVSSR